MVKSDPKKTISLFLLWFTLNPYYSLCKYDSFLSCEKYLYWYELLHLVFIKADTFTKLVANYFLQILYTKANAEIYENHSMVFEIEP